MHKWEVNGEEFTNSARAAQEVTDQMGDEPYDDMLYACYGDDIAICGLHYDPVYVFHEIDPIAYRVGRADYYSDLESDIEDELDRMDDGDEKSIYGVTVRYFYDEAEDSVSIEEVAAELGWAVAFNDNDKTVIFSNCSPKGEDLEYEIEYDELADIYDEMLCVAEDFDEDEHVAMWVDANRSGTGGVPTVAELVEDAAEIRKMLWDLTNKLEEVLR